MTAITTNDEALAVARNIEEYLWTLDRGNALKNGDNNTRLSPITSMAKALAEWLAAPAETTGSEVEDDWGAIIRLRGEIGSYLPEDFLCKTYYRPATDGRPPYYETIIGESRDGHGFTVVVGTFAGASVRSSLETALRAIEADAIVNAKAGLVR